ncbi:Uncharacterised protein [Neisseria elongata subsp. glycolytica]|nr:Uncharacterised protein [Neisseria elongata subsp. glycolytica]
MQKLANHLRRFKIQQMPYRHIKSSGYRGYRGYLDLIC